MAAAGIDASLHRALAPVVAIGKIGLGAIRRIVAESGVLIAELVSAWILVFIRATTFLGSAVKPVVATGLGVVAERDVASVRRADGRTVRAATV